MKHSERIKLLEDLFKVAEKTHEVDEFTKRLETTTGQVWADLETLSHYLKYEINETNVKDIAAYCMGIVHDIRKKLYFNPKSPFKDNE